MKSNKRLIVGFALLLTGVAGLLAIRSNIMPMRGGMGIMQNGGGMMGQGNMKEMMKRMMGDQLPPGIDAADLPDSQSQGRCFWPVTAPNATIYHHQHCTPPANGPKYLLV